MNDKGTLAYHLRGWYVWSYNTYIYYRYAWDDRYVFKPYLVFLTMVFLYWIYDNSVYLVKQQILQAQHNLDPTILFDREELSKTFTLLVDKYSGGPKLPSNNLNLYETFLKFKNQGKKLADNINMYELKIIPYQPVYFPVSNNWMKGWYPKVTVDYQTVILLNRILQHCDKIIKGELCGILSFHWSIDDFLCERLHPGSYNISKIFMMGCNQRILFEVEHPKGMLLGLYPGYHYQLHYTGSHDDVKDLGSVVHQINWVIETLYIWGVYKRDKTMIRGLIRTLEDMRLDFGNRLESIYDRDDYVRMGQYNRMIEWAPQVDPHVDRADPNPGNGILNAANRMLNTHSHDWLRSFREMGSLRDDYGNPLINKIASGSHYSEYDDVLNDNESLPSSDHRNPVIGSHANGSVSSNEVLNNTKPSPSLLLLPGNIEPPVNIAPDADEY